MTKEDNVKKIYTYSMSLGSLYEIIFLHVSFIYKLT